MNIGIFTDTYCPIISGVATSIMMLEKELTKKGHTVYIFTTSNPLADKHEHNIIRIPSMPFYFLKSQRMAIVYPPNVLFNIKKYELDIIHTQTEFPLGIFGKIVSQFYKIPLVHTYHTMYEDYVHYIANGHIITPSMAQGFSRIFCNRARVVIAPVEKARESLINYGVKRPIEVIPTGIDFIPFSKETYTSDEINETKQELGLDLDTPILVSIGRVAKEKSIDVIIRQLPSIVEKTPNIKFVIIGDGPYLDELKNLARSLNVENNILFAGSKPWATIGKYYQIGDMFISASTSETQGLTYIEAMAASVPVLAKKDKSVEGIIEDKVTGLYFEDENEIAHIVCQYISDKNQLDEISVRALEKIQPLSSQIFAENLENLYSRVISDFKNTKPKFGNRARNSLRNLIKKFPLINPKLK